MVNLRISCSITLLLSLCAPQVFQEGIVASAIRDSSITNKEADDQQQLRRRRHLGMKRGRKSGGRSKKSGGSSSGDMGPEKIRVMVQNLFLGGYALPLFLAAVTGASEEVFAALTDAFYAQVSTNNFQVRAVGLAEKICQEEPHVLGLQEVYKIELDGQSGPPLDPMFNDMLTTLVDQIETSCGLVYNVASSVQLAQQKLPPTETWPGEINFIDRDVILARSDLYFVPVSFGGVTCAQARESGVDGIDATGCIYQALLQPIPEILLDGVGFSTRGYVGADVVVDGTVYRIVNTHLEVDSPDGTDFTSIFQTLQAAELIAAIQAITPADTNVLVVGDFNSPADALPVAQPFNPPPFAIPAPFNETIIPPHLLFTSSGYTDIWTDARNAVGEGTTYCSNDGDLTQPVGVDVEDLSVCQRIDYVMALGPIKRSRMDVFGEEPEDLVQGIRFSDHFGLDATVVFVPDDEDDETAI